MPRLHRAVLLALAVLLPAAAAAQPLMLRPPSVSDALRELNHHPPRTPGEGGLEQTFVIPERPGQNQVAWYDFEWQYVDVPPPGGGPGGIRLYYYRSAAAQARRALPAIRSGYARLVAEFAYVPTKQIPFILYGTQREFQTQNVFQVSESVLGVTSPQDLKMSVPYFGDHARFIEVATHEMVHQFTIQKLMDSVGGDAFLSPVSRLPLWFVEGIAEYYTKGGLDVETDGYLRDLVWNPDASKRYQVIDFAEDRFRGYLPTYKLGQARIHFIAEVYGREKIQGFLENAGLLGDGMRGGDQGDGKAFDGLVRRVLDEPVDQVNARWRAWLKKRYFAEYVQVRQDLPSVRELRGLPDEPERFVASPDGNAILVRGIDREKGRARLWLSDLRNPRGAKLVAEDGSPGMESLHPIDYGVMALAEGLLVFSSQDGSGDRLTVRKWARQEGDEGRPPRVTLGSARILEVRSPSGGRFVRIADPAFSPDATQLAFVGVAGDGEQDVYVVPVTGGTARRLTDDFFSEKDLAWGPDGIYCASDATEHGRFNLFRIDVATGARTRLTTWAHDDRAPRPQADGTVLFSTDAAGKPDLALLEQGAIRRVTDFTTGLTTPYASPKARGILASTFHGGVFRLVEVPKVAWLVGTPVPVEPPAGEVLPIAEADLPDDPPPYRPLAISNWRPEAGIVYGGGTGNAVAGRAAVIFSDYLRDHVLFMDLAVLGSFDYTQGLILFQNRSHRTSYSFGGYHFVQQSLDRLDPNLVYLQRDFGLVAGLQFPVDRFRRWELELSAGGQERYCLTDTAAITLNCVPLTFSSSTYASVADWRRQNGGIQAIASPAVRWGYDTVRYDELTGPLEGSSAIAELGGSWLPGKGAVNGYGRLEAAHWFQLIGRSNLMFRVSAASSFSPNEAGRRWQKSWWLSSADNLRGYSPFDFNYLIGQHYYVSNLELQIPMDAFIRFLFFDHIEGVAALDFGGVFNQWSTRTAIGTAPQPGAWASRTLTGVLGVNVLLGPILLRLHWGHPFDIGGVETPALQAKDRWVTNLTLRYFFF